MNGFGKALIGIIRVSMDRVIVRSFWSGIISLVLATIVLLALAGSVSAATPITNCTELQDVKSDLSVDYYLANDNNTEFNHSVTRDEINNGGFGQDIIIDDPCTGEIGCVNSTGYVYQCGETVMESCIFNGDMNCPATGNGLVVGGDNIVIDGAGYLLNVTWQHIPESLMSSVIT